MLREKTAEVLLRAPTRLWTLDSYQDIEEEDYSFEQLEVGNVGNGYAYDMGLLDYLDNSHDSMNFFDMDANLSSQFLDLSMPFDVEY